MNGYPGFFLILKFYFRIILDSHKSCKGNTESSHTLKTQYPLLTSPLTITLLWHIDNNEYTNIDNY